MRSAKAALTVLAVCGIIFTAGCNRAEEGTGAGATTAAPATNTTTVGTPKQGAGVPDLAPIAAPAGQKTGVLAGGAK